jgi:predicted NAD/FAD-dependent oxidoreductase
LAALDFGAEKLALADGDGVVLAVPAPVAAGLVPALTAPSQFRAIVNAHYRIAPPAGFPAILAVVNGTVEWLFSFEGRLSLTISGADRLIDADREQLARDLWAEVAQLTGLHADLPAWQIVKERRATFAALPEEEAKRPPAATAWPNLVLAGDWTRTGLPATIEGSIRSGNNAARQLHRTGL